MIRVPNIRITTAKGEDMERPLSPESLAESVDLQLEKAREIAVAH